MDYQTFKTSTDSSLVLNLSHRAPPYKSDDGGQAYMNGVGTIADESVYQPDTGVMDPTTIPGSTRDGSSVRDEGGYRDRDRQVIPIRAGGITDDRRAGTRNDSPQFPEEEIYKLRLKTRPSAAPVDTHRTWEVAKEDRDYDCEGGPRATVTDSGIPEIPDTTARQDTPSLPPIPQSEAGEMVHMQYPHWTHQRYGSEIQHQTPPWQLIHQRLLNWAIIWPMSELDAAVRSTIRGHQVNEISLSIWATQSYKRYVRSLMTDSESPPGRMDRLFVPPNIADAISTAVFNGRHRDGCMMLRNLWGTFGLDGIPRLLIVLAKHREDENHWVAHRCACRSCTSAAFGTLTSARCLDSPFPMDGSRRMTPTLTSVYQTAGHLDGGSPSISRGQKQTI